VDDCEICGSSQTSGRQDSAGRATGYNLRVQTVVSNCCGLCRRGRCWFGAGVGSSEVDCISLTLGTRASSSTIEGGWEPSEHSTSLGLGGVYELCDSGIDGGAPEVRRLPDRGPMAPGGNALACARAVRVSEIAWPPSSPTHPQRLRSWKAPMAGVVCGGLGGMGDRRDGMWMGWGM
jgi:hypothetical protein